MYEGRIEVLKLANTNTFFCKCIENAQYKYFLKVLKIQIVLNTKGLLHHGLLYENVQTWMSPMIHGINLYLPVSTFLKNHSSILVKNFWWFQKQTNLFSTQYQMIWTRISTLDDAQIDTNFTNEKMPKITNFFLKKKLSRSFQFCALRKNNEVHTSTYVTFAIHCL